jgi:hypothetical protein
MPHDVTHLCAPPQTNEALWSADRLIATCAKGSRQEFRITLKNFRYGRKFELGIFEKNGLGEFMPTKRRVLIAPADIHDVIGILKKTEDFALDEGLIP